MVSALPPSHLASRRALVWEPRVRGETGLPCPLPPGTAGGPQAGPGPSPSWARSVGVRGGERVTPEDVRTCRVHLSGLGRGAAALAPRSPRPPVGGALVMHYSSPSPPPAPPPPPSLSPRGCGLRRGAGAGAGAGSGEPSQYCGSSASDGSGEAGAQPRRQAAGAAAGRGPGGGDSGSPGPQGAQAGRGCGLAQGI